MQEWVARNRPGQSVGVTYRRSNTDHQVQAVLKKYDGTLQMKKPDVSYQMEGAQFEDISYARLTQLNLDGGVLIKKIEEGKWKKGGAKENFIITHIDKAPIDNVTDLNRILDLKQGGVLVEGLQANGEKGAFAIEW
jgi:S1-C subfamily serine protease